MIEFNNVSKIYNNNVKALSDVSVKIDSGDFVFLVGPSGSGKSTFIKMLLKSGGFSRVAILCGSYAPCKIERIVNSDAVLYEKHSDSFAFSDRGLFGNTVRKAN